MKAVPVHERRIKPRFKMPAPSPFRAFLFMTDRIGRKIYHSWVNTGILLLVIAVSLSMILWGIYVRIPEADKLLTQYRQKESLQKQLLSIEKQWSEPGMLLLEKKISKEQARVFNGVDSLAQWLVNKAHEAAKLGFNMNYIINKQNKTRLKNIYTLSIVITLKVKGKPDDSIYTGALKFIRRLIEENQHLNISVINMKSLGHGVDEMVIEISVWVRDINAMLKKTKMNNKDNVDENTDITGL